MPEHLLTSHVFAEFIAPVMPLPCEVAEDLIANKAAHRWQKVPIELRSKNLWQLFVLGVLVRLVDVFTRHLAPKLLKSRGIPRILPSRAKVAVTNWLALINSSCLSWGRLHGWRFIQDSKHEEFVYNWELLQKPRAPPLRTLRQKERKLLTISSKKFSGLIKMWVRALERRSKIVIWNFIAQHLRLK